MNRQLLLKGCPLLSSSFPNMNSFLSDILLITKVNMFIVKTFMEKQKKKIIIIPNLPLRASHNLSF